MAYDFKKPTAVRVLAQPATDSFAAQRDTADYHTFTEAMADIANWTTLVVYPGTFLFDTATLSAGKAIRGVDRDACILQSTNNTLDAAVLSCGNGSTLENIYIRAGGTPAAANRVHLIDFGAAIAGQYINLINVRVDNGGGTQPYRIDAPCYGTNCWIDFYINANSVAVMASRWMFTRFTLTAPGDNYPFWLNTSDQNQTFIGCTFTRLSANGSWIYNNNASPTITITACAFVSGRALLTILGATAPVVTVSGTFLGGLEVANNAAAAVMRLRGNVQYGALSLSDGTVAEIDWGLSKSVTSTPTTLYGWESLVYVSRAGAVTITLPYVARSGMPSLLIKDTSGNASRYNITINRATTDTIDGATSYVIREDYGWVLLVADTNPSPDQWHVVASSRDVLSNVMGSNQTYGFFGRGWAAPDGDVGLRGQGLYDNINVTPAGTWGFDANGAYLQVNTTGAAGDLAYAYTSQPNGPLAAAANWDLVFYWEPLVQSNDQRIACGAFDTSGVAISTFLGSNTPDRPCVLVQKLSGATTAQLYVRSNAGGVTATAAFATWTPAANTAYYVAIRKRGNVYVAYAYNSGGALIEAVTLTTVTHLLSTADLAVVCGMNDTGGAAGRHIRMRSWYGHQIPSGMSAY